MKRALIIVGCVLCVIATVFVVIYVLMRTDIIGKEDIVPTEVSIFTDDAGRTYTEKNWMWKPIESKKIISYKDVSGVKTTTVSLALADGLFYDVRIPDVPYIYDFGKTIWAEDGSFMIRVVGQATMDTLSQLAGIDDGDNINQYTLKSKDGVKGAKTIATIIDGSAIIVNIYDGDETYSIIRDSIADNRSSYTIDEIPFSKGCKYLQSVKYEGNFVQSVTIGNESSLSNNKYLFADGTLWIQSVVIPYEQAVKYSLAKLVTSSPTGKVEQYYETDTITFAKSSDYYIAVIYVNANTSVTIVGEGEEALCNIVSIIAGRN